MKVELQIHGIDGVLSTLEALPAEVVSKRGGPVKLALAKGARLLRDQAKDNFRRSVAQGGADSTETTVENIVASRGKAPVGTKGERQLVRVKRRSYINAKGAKTTTLRAAQLMEYGSATQPARPWLRSAVQRRGSQIIDVVSEDLLKRLDQITKRLAAQNGGRR
ncbi:hypothetical protein [Stenotrophomonas maltophilia]|uniref:hypothetical protein n=1 Tax=Stenotrophomonas maltophilia TaxID=40324 RepID=UPI0013FE40F5|nr:hypothetical protein [Stenotrophomonas maltophilia]MCO7458406.1 hypothetical protein [Stenotrophomonas maltophilia]MCO7466414.1 hypothetical protein [Stenotrophomonas maltophilia]MCO7482562.1 hypothetical protein [Stenotrophomonas maltophilia]MCO7491687.1 hypothetical protein [Stenotrophomonas maltophilia]